MALVTYFERFLTRGGLLAAVKAFNEVPLGREIISAYDTGALKLGNATDNYNDLPVINPGCPAFQYRSDTGSTADSDPGAGLFKWNHATQTSATFLYFDDVTADTATDLSTYFSSLATGQTGFVHIVNEEDRTQWQSWKWTALTDGTGYWKFAVTLQASTASIPDNVPVRVAFTPVAAGYTDEQVRDVMGATLVQGANVTISVDDTANTITIASSGGGGGTTATDPRYVVLDPMSDFLGKPPAAVFSGTSQQSWTWGTVSIGGGITSIAGGAGSPGVWRLNSGTSASGICNIQMGDVANLTLGGGAIVIAFRFRVPTVSTGTQRFGIDIGLRSAWSGASTERLHIFFRDDLNGGAIRVDGTVGGVTTSANGTTVPAANTWYACELRINAAGTTCALYMATGGAALTLEATLSSGLPTGAMILGARIEKAVGTTARELDLDYLQLQQSFTTLR